GNGIIYDKSIDYIRSLDAGKGAQIPFLHEVFDLIDRRVGINIEIKSRNTAKPVLNLINHYIREYGWSIDNFMISSFNQFELKTVRNLHPTIKIGILMFGLPVYFGRLLQTLNPYSINISIEFINQWFIKTAHRKGLKVFVYTANYPDDIRRMIDMDVDGIITDYPDRVKTIISESTVKGSDENT
ncbi:MAG: glycerophosphodiester phosphodiesterase, partial [Candidatus Marinimicrobia bacterium]|nr:glycerophosphodiester phosphodiesterase [Candidatus Neomarinimicrobiota bacterium]